MSLRLGVWPQLLADRCKLLGVEAPAGRLSADRVEDLRARAWDVERSISSQHSDDPQGDAILWLTSKYRVDHGGLSFAAACAELEQVLWAAETAASAIEDLGHAFEALKTATEGAMAASDAAVTGAISAAGELASSAGSATAAALADAAAEASGEAAPSNVEAEPPAPSKDVS